VEGNLTPTQVRDPQKNMGPNGEIPKGIITLRRRNLKKGLQKGRIILSKVSYHPITGVKNVE